MKRTWKDTLVRALRTFAQAAIGYLAANLCLIKWDDGGAAKTTALTVITAAVACGLAALMNLPKDEETEDQAASSTACGGPPSPQAGKAEGDGGDDEDK